jgi:hypothetical protein
MNESIYNLMPREYVPEEKKPFKIASSSKPAVVPYSTFGMQYKIKFLVPYVLIVYIQAAMEVPDY